MHALSTMHTQPVVNSGEVTERKLGEVTIAVLKQFIGGIDLTDQHSPLYVS